MGRGRKRIAALLVILMLVPAGGCTTTPQAGSGPVAPADLTAAQHRMVNPSTRMGGALRLGSSNDGSEWDPARAYAVSEWNLQRLYTRTLVTAAATPGPAGTALVPDLAQSPPEISDGGRTYRFTLRPGLRFEDGSPITAQDVKYGIERVFAQDVLSGGPVYLIDQLDQGQHYPGPYRDPDPAKLGLRSVRTPDAHTIEFHLDAPFADFLYLLAMGPAAPVPRAVDTGVRYADRPVSSGPYRLTHVDPGRRAVLERNPHWQRSSDPVRRALPDRIEIQYGLDPNELDRQLFDGALDLNLDQVGLQPATRTTALRDPQFRRAVDAADTGALSYAAMSIKVPPFDNIHCRRAVQYAVDKPAIRDATGGPDAGGTIATTLLPPTIPGHDPGADLFHTRGGAQPDQARAELAACGHPTGFNTIIAVANAPRPVHTAEALQQSLAAVGITARIDPADPALYDRSVAGTPDVVHRHGYGIMLSAWSADFPDGAGFLAVLVDGRTILPSGNNNLAELDDPDLYQLIDQARATPPDQHTAQLWQQVDARAMHSAALLPLVYARTINYRNPRVTNAYISAYYGQLDLSTLGVA